MYNPSAPGKRNNPVIHRGTDNSLYAACTSRNLSRDHGLPAHTRRQSKSTSFFFISLLYLYMHRSGKVSNSRNKIRQTCAPRLLAEPCMYTFIMPFHTTLPWHVILVHSFTLERLYGERKRVCVQSSKSNSNPTKRELLQCGSLRSAYYISPIQVGRLSIYDVRIELWSEVRHRYRGHPKRP